MRELNGHKVNECNEAITITADERDPNNGNASHEYEAHVQGKRGFWNFHLRFQHGPIKEVGVNGLTNEALLAIVIDRLEGFQLGPYACVENQEALDHLLEAQHHLKQRTRARVARGVEGTHAK